MVTAKTAGHVRTYARRPLAKPLIATGKAPISSPIGRRRRAANPRLTRTGRQQDDAGQHDLGRGSAISTRALFFRREGEGRLCPVGKGSSIGIR